MSTLAGRFVALEPLEARHAPGLLAAAGQDQSTYRWTGVPTTPAEMTDYIAGAAAARDAGHQQPYAVRRLADGVLVGSTRFLNIERWRWAGSDGRPDSTEVGSTWYAASAQRTAVNTECKLLLLTEAFEVWHVQRLQLKTDARNLSSRAAIERIGATFEGVLRNYQPGAGPDGAATGVRDTAMYSILPGQWPVVRAALVARLLPASG